MSQSTNVVALPTLTATQSSPSLLDNVITEARKNFISGYTNNKEIAAKLREEKSLKNRFLNFFKHREFMLRKEHNYLEYKDKDFATYDANHIPGSKFIAAYGPKDSADLKNLFDDIIFNPKHPVKQIISLGSHLGTNLESPVFQDFCDYAVTERKDQKIGPYHLTVERISGKASYSHDGKECYPHDVIESRLIIKRDADDKNHIAAAEHQVNVTVFGVIDNQSISLHQKNNNQPATHDMQKLEALWQLYQKSLQEHVLIHCAAGVGRTGHLILTFEILKHHDTIFASSDPVKIADEIHKVLLRIRSGRPAAVNTPLQYEESIRNAEILYHYGLEKELQHTTSMTASGP